MHQTKHENDLVTDIQAKFIQSFLGKKFLPGEFIIFETLQNICLPLYGISLILPPANQLT
jgi:hypothetical protein